MGSVKLELGELGTLFAGWFSPLAFIWFIIAYYQQKEELSLNTQTLELQRRELQRQVKFLEIQSSALTSAAKNINEHTRPYLSMSFQKKHRNIYVILKNTGIRAALKPNFEFSQPLSLIGRKNTNHNYFHKIKCIAPGQEISYLINSMSMLLNGKKEVLFDSELTITYEGSELTTYKEIIPLSLKVAKNDLISPPGLETTLYEISLTNKELVKELKKCSNVNRADG